MGGAKLTNLQDQFLNQLRKEKITVIVYLTNGVRLKGTIRSFDNFVIILKDTRNQLIYKHAVSTIVPEQDVNLKIELENEQ
ncbi:MAG: RNA chaperone Hfq [Nitrospirae bacterium]|nr:RNA chaperone Hfq [Nitrospirota bacterium]